MCISLAGILVFATLKQEHGEVQTKQSSCSCQMVHVIDCYS
jgi:hypothetical protein